DGLELGPAVSLDGHQIGLTLGKQILVLLAHFTPLAVERKAPTNSCHRLHARRPRFAMHRLTPSAAIAALEPAITPRLCVLEPARLEPVTAAGRADVASVNCEVGQPANPAARPHPVELLGRNLHVLPVVFLHLPARLAV